MERKGKLAMRTKVFQCLQKTVEFEKFEMIFESSK